MNLFYRLLSLISEVSYTLLNIYELSANIAQMFLWVWFLTKYFGFKDNKKTNIIGFILTWFICFCEITFIETIRFYFCERMRKGYLFQ